MPNQTTGPMLNQTTGQTTSPMPNQATSQVTGQATGSKKEEGKEEISSAFMQELMRLLMWSVS